MKTVITAIANPIINNELKKEKNIEVETINLKEAKRFKNKELEDHIKILQEKSKG